MTMKQELGMELGAELGGELISDFPLPFTTSRRPPCVALPPGAVDAHMHIYDTRWPMLGSARLRPAPAVVADYRRWQQAMGLARTVVVTPSAYGLDNRATLAAVAALNAQAQDNARAVVVIDGRQSRAELAALHAAGVRGVRLNFSQGNDADAKNPRDINGLGLDDLERIAHTVADLGWHVQVLMPSAALLAAADRLRGLAAPIVFDHFARLGAADVGQEAHAVVVELLRTGRAWLKLSGGYIVSAQHDSTDPALVALARSFMQAAPDRIVWGSDWPHVTATCGPHPLPDDAAQLEALAHWCDAPTSGLLTQVLATNPARLYGF